MVAYGTRSAPPTLLSYEPPLPGLAVPRPAHRRFCPAGTGKTAYVKRHLASGLPAASFVPCLLNFSAQTSANTTQVTGRRRDGEQHAALPCELYNDVTVVVLDMLLASVSASPSRSMQAGLATCPIAECSPHHHQPPPTATDCPPQDVVDGRLDKRRRGVWGPAGGRRMVVFVDDLNMPQARPNHALCYPCQLLQGQMTDWCNRLQQE
jgi:hypothetical protein